MLELGKNSDFYHKNISKIVNQSNIDKLFVYGKNVFKTYQETHKRKQGNVLHLNLLQIFQLHFLYLSFER